jgi:translation initiation factor IF-1
MVKNTTGGSKHKKQKNSSTKVERPLTIKENNNEGYGQVMSFLGGSMVMVRKLGTKVEFRCRLRKSLPRIYKKDYVLYAIREFETKDVGDVILVYTMDEVYTLKKEKHIDEEVEQDDIFGEDDDKEDDKEDENINVTQEEYIDINAI